MKKTLNFILLTIMGGISIATSQTPAVMVSDKASWHKIGERTVDFARDNDEIVVVGADRFAAIQFKVKDAPIDLISLEVYYDSGDKQKIAVNSPVKINGESKIINLNGGERDLKKIVFVYKTMPNSKDVKALVEVWGMKTNTDEKKESNANTNSGTTEVPSLMVSDQKGWHRIGERTVEFTKDHDEIVVVGADRFASIKFAVTEASIQLISLSVYFESGDMQKIPVNSPVMIGTQSKVISLNGGERNLKKIVFEYKTLPNQTAEKANVEVWGLKTNLVVK